MRAALYARYSTDLQSDTSIEDQLRDCADFAERRGDTVVETYTDKAKSGAHAASREGLQTLLRDARAGAFDVVIAEALDRLSRDQEDTAAIHKRLTFLGIPIVTVSGGEVTPLRVGFEATMNAEFLTNLAHKIRRGQRGRAAAGHSPGGLAYGYDVVRKLDDAGEPVRGLRQVNADQAAVIRQIYAEYAAGSSPRAIAARLNADGVPSPTGKQWSASTINGNRKRRSGILYNEGYLGFIVYNRVRMVRDPDTGKRLSRDNDPADWQVTKAPHLRIVDDATWQAVQARKALAPDQPARRRRTPRRLLSGLVKCGVCGGGFTIVASDRLGCSAHRERGTCGNGHAVKMNQLETRALAALRDKLAAPELVEKFVKDYRAARRKQRKSREKARRADRTRLAEINPLIERLVDAICYGTSTAASNARLVELEHEKASVEAELEADDGDAEIIDLHPNLAAQYRRRLDDLQGALDGNSAAHELASRALRGLIDKIVIHPGDKRGDYTAEMHGQVAALAALAGDQGAPPGSRMMVKVVAEERYRHKHHWPAMVVNI